MQYLKVTATHYFDSDIHGNRSVLELHQLANSANNSQRHVHSKEISKEVWEGEEYSDGYFSTSIYLQLPQHIRFFEYDLESLDELLQVARNYKSAHSLQIEGIETLMDDDDVVAITSKIPGSVTPIVIDIKLFDNWNSD